MNFTNLANVKGLYPFPLTILLSISALFNMDPSGRIPLWLPGEPRQIIRLLCTKPFKGRKSSVLRFGEQNSSSPSQPWISVGCEIIDTAALELQWVTCTDWVPISLRTVEPHAVRHAMGKPSFSVNQREIPTSVGKICKSANFKIFFID